MDDQAPELQTPESAPETGAPEAEKPSFRLDLYYWTQALVMALVFLVLAFSLVGRVISVVGPSMENTLFGSDLLLLQSVGYSPKQGDVVVLRKPGFPRSGTAPIVKRVIAVGGQHVQVDYTSNQVLVDGKALDEPYIKETMYDPFSTHMTNTDVVVPEGEVYVMGDNRNNSSDSRDTSLGTVDTRYILGRVLCVVFPFQHFAVV